MSVPRIIFHIDVNSAFLSWSAVKMVREGKPDIRLVPSVVSGDPSDRRSIITAASSSPPWSSPRFLPSSSNLGCGWLVSD